jgi:hypothetical protein
MSVLTVYICMERERERESVREREKFPYFTVVINVYKRKLLPFSARIYIYIRVL